MDWLLRNNSQTISLCHTTTNVLPMGLRTLSQAGTSIGYIKRQLTLFAPFFSDIHLRYHILIKFDDAYAEEYRIYICFLK